MYGIPILILIKGSNEYNIIIIPFLMKTLHLSK